MNMGAHEYMEDGDKVVAGEVVLESEKEALVYATDESEGIRRKRWGRGFSYFQGEGKRVRRKETLERIKGLAIPPAWTEVWISPDAAGHVQATGRDAKGRKQYIYHPLWNKIRTRRKFDRLISFGRALPKIRRQVDMDLRKRNLSWTKVTSIVVALLDKAKIRVGNSEYLRENRSFGLTTLRNRHVDVLGSTVHIEFKGKSGKIRSVDIENRRLARQVKRCQELPGQELFQYLDDEGTRRPIRSEDVNEYLREIASDDFTAKDFRTWWGTVLMAEELHESRRSAGEGNPKKNILAAVRAVAKELGNTLAICRKYYIHPAVIEGFETGLLFSAFKEVSERKGGEEELGIAERAVLELLAERRRK